MLILNNLSGFGAGNISSNYETFGVDTDSGYLTRGAMTADADGKTGTVSFWFNNRSGDTSTDAIYESTRFAVYLDSGQLYVSGFTSGGTQILRLYTNKMDYDAGTGWHHFMASWDLNAGAGHVYVDGVSDRAASPLTLTNSTINYNTSLHTISAASLVFPGDLAEFYLSRNYIDLSVQANRDKFITSSGYPVYLGSTGTLPNGSQPIVYVKGPVASWGTNYGYGGNFTQSGTLTTSTTSPSNRRAIVSFRQAWVNSSASSTSHTFSSVDIGRPATDRYVILGIVVDPDAIGTKTISSVDIGGTSATPLYQPDVDFTSGGDTYSYMAQFWAAAIPTGTTATTMTITYGGTAGVNMGGAVVGVYAAYNLNSITPIYTDAQGLGNEGSGGTLQTFNLTTQANGFAIGHILFTGGSCVWTGLVEHDDSLGTSLGRSGSTASVGTTSTSLTVTIDPASTGEVFPGIVGAWR